MSAPTPSPASPVAHGRKSGHAAGVDTAASSLLRPGSHVVMPPAHSRLLVALACLLIVVVMPHVREDFAYGDLLAVNAPPALAAAGLLIAAVLHASGLWGAVRRRPWGALVLAASGALWSLGVIVFHGHDLLFAGPHYRAGFISRFWEVGIIVIGAGLVVTGWQAWSVSRRPGAAHS
jgi:hypothetical protein